MYSLYSGGSVIIHKRIFNGTVMKLVFQEQYFRFCEEVHYIKLNFTYSSSQNAEKFSLFCLGMIIFARISFIKLFTFYSILNPLKNVQSPLKLARNSQGSQLLFSFF